MLYIVTTWHLQYDPNITLYVATTWQTFMYPHDGGGTASARGANNNYTSILIYTALSYSTGPGPHPSRPGRLYVTIITHGEIIFL